MNSLSTSTLWNPWNLFKSSQIQQSGRSSSSEMTPFGYFGPFMGFYRDMDRMFENVFGPMAKMPASMMAEAFNPKVNLAATDKEYTVTAEIPGMSEKDIRIDLLDEGALRIRGEKKQEHSDKSVDMHRTESSYGFFERVLPLPQDVDLEDVSASCENGLLTITLARKEQAKQSARQVQVNASGQGSGKERVTGISDRQQEHGRSNQANNVPPRKTAA